MIYLIYNKDSDHVKIGYSKDPEKRLKMLQTGNSHKLTLLDCINGSLKEEKNIHRDLKEYKCLGEWYVYSEIKDVLSGIIKSNKYKINVYKKERMNFISIVSSYNNLTGVLFEVLFYIYMYSFSKNYHGFYTVGPCMYGLVEFINNQNLDATDLKKTVERLRKMGFLDKVKFNLYTLNKDIFNNETHQL